MYIKEKLHIDCDNIIEKDVNGCKVRLFFCLEPNIKVERNILDNLLLVFDQTNHEMSSVQT